MVASVGNLNVKLSLDPTPLLKGIAAASATLDKFGKGVAGAIRSGFMGAGSAIKFLEDAVTKPLTFMENLVKQIPYVGGLLALPFEGARALMGVYAEGSKKISEIGMAAMKAGASVAGFQTAMYGTKLDADTLTPALFKLNTKVVEAAMGAEDGSRLFNKYGLSARELVRLDVDKRLELIADKFRALKDPALQARMAFDLFGKAGNSMLPFLNKGPEGIAKARKMLAETGLGISDQDFKNVKEAAAFGKMIERLKDSVTMEVTKGLAPFLAELSSLFDGVNLGAKGLSEYVQVFASGFVFAGSVGVELFKKFTEMLPGAGGFFSALSSTAQNFFAGAIEGTTQLVQLIERMVKAAGDLMTRLGGVSGILSTLNETLNVGIPIGDDRTYHTLSRGVPAGPASAADRLKTAQAELKKAFGDLGKTAFGDVWDKAKADYAAFMTNVEARNKQTSKAMAAVTKEAVQAMYGDRIKQYEDAAKGPLDKFQEDMRKLQEVDAMANQFGLMSDKTYALNANKLFKQLEGAFPKQETRFAGAVVAGSKEAYSADLKFMYGDKQQDPQQRMIDLMQQALMAEKEQEKNGRKVVEALREITRRGI